MWDFWESFRAAVPSPHLCLASPEPLVLALLNFCFPCCLGSSRKIHFTPAEHQVNAPEARAQHFPGDWGHCCNYMSEMEAAAITAFPKTGGAWSFPALVFGLVFFFFKKASKEMLFCYIISERTKPPAKPEPSNLIPALWDCQGVSPGGGRQLSGRSQHHPQWQFKGTQELSSHTPDPALTEITWSLYWAANTSWAVWFVFCFHYKQF